MGNSKSVFPVIPELNRLVHEPARLMILAVLHVVEEADFLFVQKETGLSRGNLSSHMTKLETAEYITVRKEFAGKTPRTVLSITDSGRAALECYRMNMKAVLEAL